MEAFVPSALIGSSHEGFDRGERRVKDVAEDETRPSRQCGQDGYIVVVRAKFVVMETIPLNKFVAMATMVAHFGSEKVARIKQ